MVRCFTNLLFATVLVLVLLPASPLLAQQPPCAPATVSAASGPQFHPRTNGSEVVWVDYRGGPVADADIYGARLDGSGQFLVAGGPLNQVDVDIDGALVAWSETSADCPDCAHDIKVKNLATGEVLTVAASDADERTPAISGSRIVWLATYNDGRGALMYRDLSTAAEPQALTSWDASQGRVGVLPPRISDGQVIWRQANFGQGRNPRSSWALYSLQIGISGPYELASGEGVPSYLHPSDLADGLAAYVRGPELIAVELGTGRGWVVSSDIEHLQYVATDGRYVYWTVVSPAAPPYAALYGYDTLSRSRFMIPSGAGYTTAPDARAGAVVWARGVDTSDIFGSAVGGIVPSGCRPRPAALGVDRLYFPETGHNLAYGFKSFWERSGGLPVFGYPLTEEYEQVNWDTFVEHTVQYFERQRFEHHPEHVGTPYEVLLGRLGVEVLEAQGRHWRAFPQAAPSAPHYFAETGHAIAPEFWDYWRTHGLEFGDAGVSFRESLALFGLPISEPQLETNADGDTVLTQWFERARFEYHPANPAHSRVLLGRLAAEQLELRGW